MLAERGGGRRKPAAFSNFAKSTVGGNALCFSRVTCLLSKGLGTARPVFETSSDSCRLPVTRSAARQKPRVIPQLVPSRCVLSGLALSSSTCHLDFRLALRAAAHIPTACPEPPHCILTLNGAFYTRSLPIRAKKRRNRPLLTPP